VTFFQSPEINSIIERDYESKYFAAAAAALYIGYGVGAVIGPIGKGKSMGNNWERCECASGWI
jgi:hypothetical protein